MKAISATFTGSAREYTYITNLDLAVGDICVTQAPKGWAAVMVSAVPATVPVDPNAKFEYKELKHIVRFSQQPTGVTAMVKDLTVNSDTKDHAIAGLVSLLNNPKQPTQ